MLKVINRILIIISITLLSFSLISAQEDKTQAMPAAKVVISEVGAGKIAPQSEFIGTVYYQEVSDVASEVNGLVGIVDFEEGQRVKRGVRLIKLSSELLEKTLQSTIASHEQVLADLEKAGIEFKRAESLFKEELISEQSYDEHRFRVKGLEKKAASLRAEVERLEVELEKKIIKTPFEGVIVKKHVAQGEWLSQGAAVATIAKDDVVDIIVEVPEGVIKYATQDVDVKVKAGGKQINGKVFTIIPQGNISTRTIPIKIRVKNNLSLIEGMEARVTLPVSEKKDALFVPRDAVITVFGTTAVFAVIDLKARMIPVELVGYEGMKAGIYADGLKEGMKVVIKGNERLRDGQPVEITDKSQAPSTK